MTIRNVPASGALAVNASWRSNLRDDLGGQLEGPRPDWWWTGRPLHQTPGLQADGTVTSLPLLNLATASRAEVRDYFDNGWTLTELLFAGLRGEEAFYRPPYHQLRHPMIFYFGHPPALYVNKLRVAGLLDHPVNASFEQLFETGVDEMRWDDMSKNEMAWPSIQEVNAYRRETYAIVASIIDNHPGLKDGHPPITPSDPLWALFMGFEHERIHIETSSVLIRELPLALVQAPKSWPKLDASVTRHAGGTATRNETRNEARDEARSDDTPSASRDYPLNPLVPVKARSVQLGKPVGWPSYGWDNEYGQREVSVPQFSANQNLVSNGEFYAFLADGGYREHRYWSDTGWSWRTFRNTKHPAFWVPDGPAGLNRYRLRTVFEVVDLMWDWPAEVNYHEAKAFCAWKTERTGMPHRLLTEAEHHALRSDTTPSDALGPDAPRSDAPRSDTSRSDATQWSTRDPVMQQNGAELKKSLGKNINLGCGSPMPVTAGRPTEAGFYDVFGNVWQWLEDAFNPLSGFAVHPFYDDFSTPCFDGEHQMIAGGSWASTGDEASIFARFHFRPHFYQHAGFRCVVSSTKANEGEAPVGSGEVYEDPDVLNEYMLLHYGSPDDQMPWAFGPTDVTEFPVRCANWLLEAAKTTGAPTGTGRALDIGCAVGRASFELARAYAHVLGVDLSRAFIEAADTLRHRGERSFFRKDEGALGRRVNATIDPAIDRNRVRFEQADACALPADLGSFDAVLLANLLCRLPNPMALLRRLSGPQALVKPGGFLALFSPYSWLETFTVPEKWLGGYSRDGRDIRSATTLERFLSNEGFELIRSEDVPLVIREHQRKYQYIVTHAMLWRRRTP
ncbi:MAG: 5-histidylcysteine sulfoxide synthase [Deltaproteobacteria bacterium]|nr:5-histidylcysteine sulfoxide synthase [Deltaproteobacteria bacterium]